MVQRLRALASARLLAPSDANRVMVDRLMEMYASWRERSAAVALAYDRWTKATWPERELEFATYRIALDLEERACRRYADLAEELARVRSGRAAALAATH